MIKVMCALIEQDKRVLVTQRSAQMPQPLLWEFPGGKIEVGETEEECLIREIKEELNLDVALLTRLTPVIHTYPGAKTIELIPIICHYKSGTIELLEHCAYQWAQPQELLQKYNWCPADLPIVEEYLKQKQTTDR